MGRKKWRRIFQNCVWHELSQNEEKHDHHIWLHRTTRRRKAELSPKCSSRGQQTEVRIQLQGMVVLSALTHGAEPFLRSCQLCSHS
jgi:hypothetical protein